MNKQIASLSFHLQVYRLPPYIIAQRRRAWPIRSVRSRNLSPACAAFGARLKQLSVRWRLKPAAPTCFSSLHDLADLYSYLQSLSVQAADAKPDRKKE